MYSSSLPTMCGRLKGMDAVTGSRLRNPAIDGITRRCSIPVSHPQARLSCPIHAATKWLKMFQLARPESKTSANPGTRVLMTSTCEEKKKPKKPTRRCIHRVAPRGDEKRRQHVHQVLRPGAKHRRPVARHEREQTQEAINPRLVDIGGPECVRGIHRQQSNGDQHAYRCNQFDHFNRVPFSCMAELPRCRAS